MRTISSTFMAALMVAALFWGNCLSCPQMLLSLTTHQPAHSCCHKTKSPPTNCSTQDLRNFAKADAAGAAAPTAPIVADVVEPAAPVLLGREWAAAPLPAEHAPPDLLSLHSAFRI